MGAIPTREKINNKAKFLISRQALLDHLQETEKLLTQKVVAFRSKEPLYQEILIEKYLTLQDDLVRLKQAASKSKGDIISGEEKWDDKTITQELRQILSNFNNFLKNTGFLPA